MFYHIVYNKHRFASFNILIVTNNCEVYGLGDNNFGQLGLSHKYSVKTIQELLALKDKRIKQLSSNG